jgi:hypothetical protein
MDNPKDNQKLDDLLAAYRAAVERWIEAIRKEESLATPDHSVAEFDVWEQAGFAEEAARNRAKLARQEYIDEIRRVLYNF